jgi:hypothetical protein
MMTQQISVVTEFNEKQARINAFLSKHNFDNHSIERQMTLEKA